MALSPRLSSSSPSLGPSAFLPPLVLTSCLLNALLPFSRKHGAHFEKHKIAAQEGAAHDDAEKEEEELDHVEAGAKQGSISEYQEKNSVEKT